MPARTPVIEEINERFSQLTHPRNKPGRPLIEELGTVDYIDCTERNNTKASVTEISRESLEGKELGLGAADQGCADSQPPLSPTWATLQKLAEQVGSTMEREPIDIDKAKKAFMKRMQDTNLGDLD